MPNKPSKKEKVNLDPALDFQALLSKVTAAQGNPLAAKAALESFQSKMKAKTSPVQTQKAYQLRDEMLASRAAQGKKGVPMTEAERQAYMRKILKGMGMPVDKK